MSSSFRKLGVRRSAPGAETETTQTFHIADPAVSSNDAKESFPRRHSDRNSFLVACGVTLTCVSRHSDSRTPTIGKEEGGRRKEEGGRRKEEGGRRKETLIMHHYYYRPAGCFRYSS